MPEEKVSQNSDYASPDLAQGHYASSPAADAGPRQPSECPTCGSRNPFDYNYSCHKNADGWHRANWNLSAPPVPQEAAPRCLICDQPTSPKSACALGHCPLLTAPDWAMRAARQLYEHGFLVQTKNDKHREADERDVAALIREAGSERERELTAALRAGIAALYSANPASHEWIDAKRKFIREASRLLGGELK